MPTLCQRKKKFWGWNRYFSIPTLEWKCCKANNSTDPHRFYPLQLLAYQCQRYANGKKVCPQLIIYSTYALDRSTLDSVAIYRRKSHLLKSDKSGNSHQRVGMEFDN